MPHRRQQEGKTQQKGGYHPDQNPAMRLDYQADRDSVSLVHRSGGDPSNDNFIDTPTKADRRNDAGIEENEEQRSIRGLQIAGNQHSEEHRDARTEPSQKQSPQNRDQTPRIRRDSSVPFP